MPNPTRAPHAAPHPDAEALHARVRELEAQVRTLEAEQALRTREERLSIVAAEVGIWENAWRPTYFSWTRGRRRGTPCPLRPRRLTFSSAFTRTTWIACGARSWRR